MPGATVPRSPRRTCHAHDARHDERPNHESNQQVESSEPVHCAREHPGARSGYPEYSHGTRSTRMRSSECSHLRTSARPLHKSGCRRVRAGWWRRRAERRGGHCVCARAFRPRDSACARMRAQSLRAALRRSFAVGIPASIEVGAIRNMAVPATTTAQLGETQKLRKGVGLMGSHLQHKDYGMPCHTAAQRAAPLCVVASRRRMELGRQQLAWAFVIAMTGRGTWNVRGSFRCFTARVGTLSTHTG